MNFNNEMVSAWKNPMARKNVSAVLHPSGDVLAELKEEDLQNIAGGWNTNTLTTSTSILVSMTLGNNGWVCTATKECMPSCN
ncbi:plantaricin C family lantibiotic [Paenibacillus sp. FSL R7-0204]|uniref:plantaricin C family lantibiotic n=1 Tax=Paenibacillus sp. FSL R7-0204 TaxID=2921675 RepID=UPI0030F98418